MSHLEKLAKVKQMLHLEKLAIKVKQMLHLEKLAKVKQILHSTNLANVKEILDNFLQNTEKSLFESVCTSNNVIYPTAI